MAKKAPPPMANARRIGAGSDGSSLPMATATTPPIHAARPAMLSTAHMTDDRPQVRSATARTLPPPVGEGGALRLPWRGGQIGRAHVCTPVTNAHLVCRLLLEKNNITDPHPILCARLHDQ